MNFANSSKTLRDLQTARMLQYNASMNHSAVMPKNDSNSILSRRARRRGVRAFSLVEVTLALGIAAFGLVAAVGLIPVGLTTMRDAMDDTARSMISDRIAGEAALTSFDNLDAKYGGGQTLYFDDEGQRQDQEELFTRYRVTTRVVAIKYPGSDRAPTEAPLADNAKLIEVTVVTTGEQNSPARPKQVFSIPVAAGN